LAEREQVAVDEVSMRLGEAVAIRAASSSAYPPCRSGPSLKDILSVPAEALHDEGYLDLREAFIDGSFAPAKIGWNCVGKTKRGKGTKIMAIADSHGLPVAVHVESATPHEVTLVEATVAQTLVRKRRERLVADAAYESDQLDAKLAQRGIELIAPHR